MGGELNRLAPIVFYLVQVLTFCSLLPWLFLLFLTGFFFDAPGAQQELVTWLLAVPIWIYPIPVVACVAVSWVLFWKNKKGLALVTALLPLAYACVFLVSVFMIFFVCWIINLGGVE